MKHIGPIRFLRITDAFNVQKEEKIVRLVLVSNFK